ncbi:MAG: hypothetical protein RL481_352 [Pseudomonadota bacterium]|jgi:hypothetical protein
MNIEVNRLRFKGTSDSPHHQAFLIEDALNTLLSSEQRLVLVRRVQLGRPSVSREYDSRAAVARTVSHEWAQIIGGACHGATDSAVSANVVWFTDAEEAKAVLLARLAKNQTVDAWFWQLAVKRWRGQPVADWVAEEMREADQRGENGQAVALIERLLNAGKIEIAEAALIQFLEWEHSQWSAPFAGFTDAVAPPPQPQIFASTSENAAVVRDQQLAIITAWLPTIRKHMPSALLSMFRSLHAQQSNDVQLIALIEKFLLRAVPEISLRAELLHFAAQQFLDVVILGRAVGQPADTAVEPEKQHVQTRNDRKQIEVNDPKTLDPHIQSTDSTGEKTPLPAPAERPSSDDRGYRDSSPQPEVSMERKSAAAGLFYLFNPLRELGWPEWLSARPELLAINPTAMLLSAIAAHYRIEPTDPAFTFLRERVEPGLTIDPDITRLWRIGMDRWLKRRAGIKLAQLLAKPGWLSWRDDRLTVRFRLSNIDMQLRRQAIDRDPGWMMWAGLSVRYAFSDRPLFEDGV